MPYLVKEKFNLEDLVERKNNSGKIVICEPEEYLSAIYEHHFLQHDFDVRRCLAADEISDLLHSFSPQILLLNIETQNANYNFVLGLLQKFPNLSLVTMGYNTQVEIIKKLMGAGVCSHIDRRLSRPKDIIYVIKTVLNYKN